MNPMITIEDTDEEVIDLASSPDDINITDNDHSECSIEKNSLPNDDTNKVNVISNTVDSNKNVSKTETCVSASTSKPVFKVMFRDESVSRQYCKRIKEFLEALVSSKIKSEENDNGLTLDVWDNNTDSTSQSIDIITESEDSQDTVCNTLFTVDTKPKLQDNFDVPTYGKKYKDVFNKPKSESDTKSKDDCPSRVMCFNCLGNHNLRMCPEPRNYANIEINRKNLKKENSKAVRYHLEDNQKFGHIIPGQLSSSLRRALGLRNNELPRHIYRMRMLGYPPGWLEEARLQHSGLSLFNSDGVPEEESNEEPGAIIEEGDKDQYDIKKIYDFPGFNVPAPPHTHDEDGQYWMTTMLPFHSKQRMLLQLRGKKADDGYKRKKLKTFNNASKDVSASEPSEMEIEDIEESVVECVPANGLFVPPLPQESPVKPPEPPSQSVFGSSDCQELQFSKSPVCIEKCHIDLPLPPTLIENSTSLLRANSPSLTELENMKKQLLVELQESNSNLNISLKSNSSNLISKFDTSPSNNEVTPELNCIRENGANTSHGSVKSVDFGTPVLQSTSPYSKLPSSEKFSRDICNVINFENLPDSTGKYEQMTGVLQKVRNTLAKLQQE